MNDVTCDFQTRLIIFHIGKCKCKSKTKLLDSDYMFHHIYLKID